MIGKATDEIFNRTSCTFVAVGGILSPAAHDLSIDDAVDSEDESDNEHYDSESDNGKL